MPNTINLRLLDNKNIVAELNGIPLAQENSYKIIAGEENATIFKIISKPNQYKSAQYTVEMVNSQGYGVEVGNLVEKNPNEYIIENDEFILPTGMAVAGYGWVQIRAYQTNEQGKEEKVPFMTFKVKVWNTLPNWKDHISEGSGGEVNITIDSELSNTSTNPVQNKVVKQAIESAKTAVYNDATNYVDEKIGNISTALDELHTYAQSLINGGVSQ